MPVDYTRLRRAACCYVIACLHVLLRSLMMIALAFIEALLLSPMASSIMTRRAYGASARGDVYGVREGLFPLCWSVGRRQRLESRGMTQARRACCRGVPCRSRVSVPAPWCAACRHDDEYDIAEGETARIPRGEGFATSRLLQIIESKGSGTGSGRWWAPSAHQQTNVRNGHHRRGVFHNIVTCHKIR